MCSWRAAVRLAAVLALVSPMVAACGFFGGSTGATVKRGIFSAKEYGVAVSPRVTNNPNPPRGGGRYLLGNSYTVRGKVYTPSDDPNYAAQGTASWYGSDFHGRLTANGEIFSANAITAAHPTLPIPSYVRVTNLDNGRSLVVRINDRGPYVSGRVIDLSHRAADLLGYVNRGSANVSVQYVAPAPLEGDDTRMLMASLEQLPVGYPQPTTQLAMATPVAVAPQPRPIATAANSDASGHLGAQPGSLGTISSKDLAAGFIGLFSYAEAGIDAEAEDRAILDAHDAVNAMATRAAALEPWANAVDDTARNIKLRLGVFADRRNAEAVATSFAMLGAVDVEAVTLSGRPATRLTLSKLKPGVAREDVLALTRELGLNAIILY